ncbi:MAG: AMP-binding protein [Robiginitomaculum sp.]|nr:AMP-binding protein [Robiginitomaculum sp.]
MSNQSHVTGSIDTELYQGTIGDALHRAAMLWPDGEALISRHQNLRLTFAELLDQSQSFALGLLELGLKPGDRVGIWAPNCVQWVITQYATSLSGMILVNINPDYRPRELKFALEKVGCKALVMSRKSEHANYVQMVDDLKAQGDIGCIEHLVLIGEQQQKNIITLPVSCKMGKAKIPGN